MQYPLGFPGRGRQTTVGSPSTTVVFYFGGYFFRNFRDKASIYYMAIWDPLRLVIDCKMNDLEWPWVAMTQGHSRSLRLNSVFVPTFLDSEGWLSKIIARIVINMVYSQRQKCRPISLHGNLQQHRAVLRAIARLFCYVKPLILAPQHRPLYFELNWALKVIQGHPYWCHQKFRTGCRRNVCRPYFWNWRRYSKTANYRFKHGLTTILRDNL